MKSAYELAMERMERESGPTRSLSDEEKERAAEIDSKFDARIAETRIGYDEQIATAGPGDRERLQEEMAIDISRLEKSREQEKDAIWKG